MASNRRQTTPISAGRWPSAAGLLASPGPRCDNVATGPGGGGPFLLPIRLVPCGRLTAAREATRMADVTLGFDELEANDLPPVCVACGARRDVEFTSRGVHAAAAVRPGAHHAAGRRSALTVEIPLCPEHGGPRLFAHQRFTWWGLQTVAIERRPPHDRRGLAKSSPTPWIGGATGGDAARSTSRRRRRAAECRSAGAGRRRDRAEGHRHPRRGDGRSWSPSWWSACSR